MHNVSIQSPSLRVIEQTLIELGFVPALTGSKYMLDWFDPITGEQCRVSNATVPGGAEIGWNHITVYSVSWIPRGWDRV